MSTPPPSRIRVISIDHNFVGGVFAAIYALLGVAQDAYYVIAKPEVVTFPIGIIMPGINFAFRLNLPKPDNPITASLALAGVLVLSCARRRATGSYRRHAF